MKIVPCAWGYVVPLLIAGAGVALWGLWWLGLPVLIVAGWVLWFFRDPERPLPQDPDAVVCPADGRVCAVGETVHPDFPDGRARYMAIFMNVFNVHVQAAPLDGIVTRVEYRPGEFLHAETDKASERNEANDLWLDTAVGPVLVRQIAGRVARRIVCRARPGDRLRRGEKFGLIRFGSRVEVFVPLSMELGVRVGQRVNHTTTVIGRAPIESKPVGGGAAAGRTGEAGVYHC
ncbi:MAG: phosphatidylserine decarboxylase [Candidatus Sumerlaeia bacterium]